MASEDYEFRNRHLQFEDPHSHTPYLLGDALTVFPTNDPDRVDEFLAEYGIDGSQPFIATAVDGVDTGRKGRAEAFFFPKQCRRRNAEGLQQIRRGSPSETSKTRQRRVLCHSPESKQSPWHVQIGLNHPSAFAWHSLSGML